MSFWDNVFDSPNKPGNTPAPQPRVWWQESPVEQYQGHNGNPVVPQEPEHHGLSQQDIQKIRKRGHQHISAEEAEQIAEYDLATKAKYQNTCPQCGSGNYITAGTRLAGVIMPTEKCFDCGLSARGPEPALGSGSGQGAVATRQIDTGGAGGSMFMKFNGVPRSYAPRA